MADVRIHDLPSAASWNGFFPQDKPGGPTECVSVATVEAKLVEDGFVKTAVLVSGYQPLENQRVSTTNNVNFNKLQIAGVDRITNAGGFVGTSLQISGATASKLARFDASKNLVSYDLTLTIGATGKTIDGTANQSWSLAEIGAQAAGNYQPLENQRLSTTDGPVFSGLTSGSAGLGGWPYAANNFWLGYKTLYGATLYGFTGNSSGTLGVYGASGQNVYIGNAATRYDELVIGASSVSIPRLASATTRLATIDAAGQIGATTWANDGPYLPLAGGTVTGATTFTGGLITAAGGFVGTSLQISGATANKLARFDASKNLVSYDLVAGDIPALSYLSKTKPVYDQHIWSANSSSALANYDCRNHIVSGTSPVLYPNHMVAGSEYIFLLRPGTQFSFTHSTGTAIIVWNGALVTQVLSITKTTVRAYCDGVYWYLE